MAFIDGENFMTMMESFTPKNIGLYTTQITNSADTSPEIRWKDETQPTFDIFVLQKLNELQEEIKELKQQIKNLKQKNRKTIRFKL